MKKQRKIMVLLGAAFFAMFAFYSCLQENELKDSELNDSGNIELFKMDNSLDMSSNIVYIKDKVTLRKNMRAHALFAENEELLEAYVDQSFATKTFLVTKSLTEDGLFQSMVYNITIDNALVIAIPAPTESSGCSSETCSNCQPTYNGDGVITKCNCADVGDSCSHTYCITNNGKKNCCTSTGGCEECDMYTSDGTTSGDFVRCDCPTVGGSCGHTVTQGPLVVGAN